MDKIIFAVHTYVLYMSFIYVCVCLCMRIQKQQLHRDRRIDFNECLIQNHLHAYQTYEIIAIIFYCGFQSYIIILFAIVCAGMFACELNIFQPNQWI